MNKRKLPKAISRTAGDMTGADAAGPAKDPWTSLPLGEEPRQAAAAPLLAIELPVVAPSPAQSLAPEADGCPAHAGIAADMDLARRQRRARAIVERYANYSALGGVIPLPLVNAASVTAVIVRMVKALSALYLIPFERDRAHAIVLALIGGLSPTAVSAMTTSALLVVLPGANLVGLAASSVAAIACTRRIGWVFVRAFESGATLADFAPPNAAK